MLGLRALRSGFSKMNLSPTVTEGAIKKASVCVPCPPQQSALAICRTVNTCRTIVSSGTTTNGGCSRWSTALPASLASTSRGSSPLSSWVLNHLGSVRSFSTSDARCRTLSQMHRKGPVIKKRPNRNPLGNKPMARGVVLKTLVKKPRKPNSANRKCVLVRLSTGKELVAYVPGEGHNLQEHNVVMVRVGRLRDVPHVKVKCIRGVYDLPHVMKKQKL